MANKEVVPCLYTTTMCTGLFQVGCCDNCKEYIAKCKSVSDNLYRNFQAVCNLEKDPYQGDFEEDCEELGRLEDEEFLNAICSHGSHGSIQEKHTTDN